MILYSEGTDVVECLNRNYKLQRKTICRYERGNQRDDRQKDKQHYTENILIKTYPTGNLG